MCIKVGLIQWTLSCLQTLNEVYFVGHLSITFHVAELQIQVPSGLTNIGDHMIIRKLNHFSGKGESQ